ncbi:MAG: T9SS type A sorting domain-containing protein [Bacteroidota bacterium]
MKKTFKTIFSAMMIGCATAGQAQNWTSAIEEATPIGGGACTPLDATTSGINYMGGYFSGSVIFGATTISSSGGSDAFLMKFTTSGGASWVTKISGTGADAIKKVESMGADVLVYGTSATSSATFYSTNGASTTIPSLGGAFLARYNSSGVLVWAVPYAANVADMAYTSSSGRLYTIGADAGSPNKTRIRSVKVATGAVLYDVLSTNTGLSTTNKGIAADASNHCYILVDGRTDFKLPSSSSIALSTTALDMVLMKLDTNLTYQAHLKIGNSGTTNETAKDVDCSSAGDVYITGTYESGTTYMDGVGTGTVNLSNGGGIDLFLAKYNTSLAPQWAKSISGTGGDIPLALSLDPNSDPFLLAQNKQYNTVVIEPCYLTPYVSVSGAFDNKWYMVKYIRATGDVDWSATPLVMDPNALPIAVQGQNGAGNIFGYSSMQTDFGSYSAYGGSFIYLARATKLICKPAVVTGIEEGEQGNTLSVYPNPTKGEFIIPITKDDINVSISMVDNMGKQVLNLNDVKNGKINIEHLANGIYFYTIHKNGNAYRGKIVKE